MNKNWLRVFRAREVAPGITPILIASLDTSLRLDLPKILFLTIGFLCIFFSSFLINELVDSYDTDKFNPERDKAITNHGVPRNFTIFAFVITSILGIIILTFLNLFWAAIGGFLLLVAYSLPPIRIKSRPILDLVAVTIGFVVLPYISYFFVSSQPITWHEPLVLLFFTCGFFAIDLVAEGADLIADKKAGLLTTAVMLGERNNLLVISFLALSSVIFGVLAIILTGHWWYFYIVVMMFFLFTAAQFGLEIIQHKKRVHELLRTGEKFGIFAAGIGTIIVIITVLVYYII